MEYLRKYLVTAMLTLCCILTEAQTVGAVQQLSDNHAMIRVQTSSRYLLIPVEEKEDNAHIRVIKDGTLILEFNCRLAIDKMDYYVPLELKNIEGMGNDVLLDVSFTGNRRSIGLLRNFACWKLMKESDYFDTVNREKYRPSYHHTPLWGWMNDPNGMFYKDGEWHLFFQHNPYGSQWENMNWGHSVSTDLIHWTQLPEAIEPDGLGTVFSGSCVVDSTNTAGFGKGAVIAFYTSNGENQTQSMAYSTNDGRTFTKYPGNPIVTSDVPDFRDPHVFWNQEAGIWNMILAAGQEMRIYSSRNLRDWMYESSFGQGYGSHEGVWECPDLMELPVRGTNKHKWMLICNINPGGPSGGSATQYFVGQFDGHRFTCESKPEVTKWLDYGKDHYATVTFSSAPDGRHVAMAWMSNWQYANAVPTKQFRSANSLPRDIELFKDVDGEYYISTTPSPELVALRGKEVKYGQFSVHKKTISMKLPLNADGLYEILADINNSNITNIMLSNADGDRVLMTYNSAKHTFGMDRRRSGLVDFSSDFLAATVAPTSASKHQTLRMFIDRSSIEIFDGDGRFVMTNLVFPRSPFTTISFQSNGRSKINNLKVWNIKY